jgi:hypothetical protein
MFDVYSFTRFIASEDFPLALFLRYSFECYPFVFPTTRKSVCLKARDLF